jgi:hypothetical protein
MALGAIHSQRKEGATLNLEPRTEKVQAVAAWQMGAISRDTLLHNFRQGDSAAWADE